MKHLIFIIMAVFVSGCSNKSEILPDIPPYELSLEEQTLNMEGIQNARQLGGYRIGNRIIKPNLLLRTGELSHATEQDLNKLSKLYHLGRIYDFRTESEQKSSPDIIPNGVEHYSLPCDFSKSSSSLAGEFNSMDEVLSYLLQNAMKPQIQDLCNNMYNNIFCSDEVLSQYNKFFVDVVNNANGNEAILWHCTQGKDRAGSASALMLIALGADKNLIMQDFALSRESYKSMVENISKIIESQYASSDTTSIESKKLRDAQYKVINTMISANPVIFGATLDSIENKHGSLKSFLIDRVGVTEEMQNILKERYLNKSE